MKQIINGIIVVEGTSDVAFLSQFIDAEFVVTNGSEISKKTIDYLQKSRENRDIFVLTDPDSPGKRIRDVLDSYIPNLKHSFISKEHAIKNGKVGVAESTKEEILNALQSFITTNKAERGNVTHFDLVKLNLEGCEDATKNRSKVIEQFRLGHCNAKTFLKRVNYLKLTFEDLRKAL